MYDYAVNEIDQTSIARKLNVSQAVISLVIKEYLREHLIESGLAIDKTTLTKINER